METEDIFEIPGNKENIERLTQLARQQKLVPFVGAGFSVPACPSWADFLEQFFQGIKEEYLLPKEEKQYFKLKEENSFEAMADFLVEKAERRKFEEEMEVNFNKPLPQGMIKKFELLHRAFPGLKVTTNFDCLIENNGAVSNVLVCYGNEPEKLHKLLTDIEQNSLLKIHGGLCDIHSIVLSSPQYEEMYGDPSGFDKKEPLPDFLKRVFSDHSVLLIGSSLFRDRIVMILESLKHRRPHFAIMLRPDRREERVPINRRLSGAGITPVWITDFGQIEDILEMLAEPVEIEPEAPRIEHGAPFVGRKKELEQIWENLEKDRSEGNVQMITGRLFNIDGAGGVGKTTLAIEAARRFEAVFKDGVLAPIRVDEHSPMSFVMQLAGQFNVKVKEPPDAETAQRLVTAILKNRHALLILDNAVEWKSLKYMLPMETCSSILVTTRNREMYHRLRLQFSDTKLRVHEIPLKKFTPDEAVDLFKRILGEKYRKQENEIYLGIAENLGFLPIALRQAISLMVFGPGYRAARLLEKLKNEDRLELLRKGHAETDSDELTIESVFDLSTPLLTQELIETLEYLAVCSPGPVPLDFLQQLAKHEEIQDRLVGLHKISWCERRERDGELAYELHQLVRELVQRRYKNRFKEEFFQLVHDIFLNEAVHFSIKDRFMPQLEEAFALGKADRDERLKKWLSGLFDFCTYRGYGDFYVRLTRKLENIFPEDKEMLSAVYSNRARIYWVQGKLEDAMALLKKKEKIKEELGDCAGLASCYGNQALILQIQGHLNEAMVLYKKVEKIFEELGDRTGLASCYGNQALILKAWGQLDAAMALHKKQEKICEELGDRTGLAISYGNQALILADQGQLDAAMALHKKEEDISRELGNKAQLARSYGNQAPILADQGQLDAAMALYKKKEKICEELSDRLGLATCYGNQALILSDQGQLAKAMALHNKEEKICEELGDRPGLGRTWWNQGEIYNKKGDYKKQEELWRKSIEMKKCIGIPTEEQEKALEELLNTRGS